MGVNDDMASHNLYAYCGNNPVNRTDSAGEAWWHWAIGAAIVVGCAAAVVVTAGGATPAIFAVASVAQGLAAATVASTATTIAAGAFIGASVTYGTAVVIAASSSKSVKEFNDKGNWWTVGATALGAGLGGLDGLIIAKQPKIEKVGTIKPSNKLKSKGNLGVKYSYNTGSAGNRAVRSFELHSPHSAGPHQQWHWQLNKWNPFTNSITGNPKHWTLFGRRKF